MRDDPYLVDTSVWIEVLARGRGVSPLRDRVDVLLGADRVATTDMVRLELLGGARTEAEYRRLGELLSALHHLAVTEECWASAAHMGFDLRRQGIPLPYTDLLIAAVAMQAGAILLHRDRHFDVVAAHLPLKVESQVATRS